MSRKPVLRTLRLPPPNFNALKIPWTRLPARTWFRVHPSRFEAAHFSLSWSHRFSHEDCPFAFLYLAGDIETCLFERFGDIAYDKHKAIAKSLWQSHSVSQIRVPELHICDLTSAKTLSALMVDLSALMHNELTTPRVWGLAIQTHPQGFEAIKFKSRFNARACLALFRRNGIERGLRETELDVLSDNDAAVDWLDKYKVSLF
jgi:hypothetical protein